MGWIASWRGSRQYAVPAIGAALTVLLVLIPLFALILFSFREGSPWAPGALTLDNYKIAYGSVQTYTMFANTALLALCGTVLSVVVALFFAFLTERTDLPFRNLAWGLMLVPMAIPGLLFAVSWTFLLSPNIGYFNLLMRDFMALFGVDIASGPLNIYSLWGMVLVEGLRGVTTCFLIMVGAFRAMDPSLEEAARTSGASDRVTFLRIFLPLLAPVLLAAAMYTFMTHLESLEVTLVLGLPAKLYVFPSYIYFTTQRFSPPEYGLSAALGASFLLASILLVYAYRRIAGGVGRYATITGKGYKPRIVHLGRWRYVCFAIFLLYFVLTIGAPCFMLVWSSLLPYYMTPSWAALAELSLTHYRAVLGSGEFLDATVNTLIVGIAAASLTMALSLTVGWIISRRGGAAGAILDGIAFLPHALPGVVIGIALTFVFIQPPLSYLGLFGSVWVITLGLTVSYIAFGSRAMVGAFAQLSQELEEAARTSGARWSIVMRRIVLPLLLPSFISGWIWVASHALRNFSIPLMLSTRESRVLSVIMWHKWADGFPGQTAALGVVLIVALAVLTVIGRTMVNRLSRRQED